MSTAEKDKTTTQQGSSKSAPAKAKSKTTKAERRAARAEDRKKESKPKRAQLVRGNANPGVTPEPTTVEPASKGGTGKKFPEKSMLLVGTWVILGDTNNVPEELVGHEACITSAPMKTSDGDEQIPWRHQYQDEDTPYTVTTRDEYSAIIPNLTVKDFTKISTNGRIGLGVGAG